MNALVELHHAEPMTTSLAFAACTENEHDSVILLVRKFIDEIQSFGEVSFSVAANGISRFEIGKSVREIAHTRDKRGRPTEFAWLNEGQSLFLLTLMRNSAVVVEFKKALIRAFLELRARDRAPPAPVELASPSHRADNLVAADRCFRAAQRTARALGCDEWEARRRANQLALERTGIDLAAAFGRDLPAGSAGRGPRDRLAPHAAFFADWHAGRVPLDEEAPPLCRPYRAHLRWAHEHDLAPLGVKEFFAALEASAPPTGEKT